MDTLRNTDILRKRLGIGFKMLTEKFLTEIGIGKLASFKFQCLLLLLRVGEISPLHPATAGFRLASTFLKYYAKMLAENPSLK